MSPMNDPSRALRQMVLAGSVAAAAFLAFLIFVYWTGNELAGVQVSSAQTINMAGRQRMLSQHLVVDAIRYASRTTDEGLRDRLRQEILAGLQDLEETHVRMAVFSEHAPALFAAKDLHLQQFVAEARALTNLPPAELDVANPHLLAMTEAMELPGGTLIAAMDGVVEAYAEMGGEALADLQQLRKLTVGGMLAFLLLGIVLVFRPLARSVRRGMEELTQSETRLQTILESLHDGMIIIDEQGNIQMFNTAATRIFGYRPEEVIGRNVKLLMPEPFHSEHDGYLSNYLSTGVRKIIGIGREVAGKRKDGSQFPVDLAVTEMRLGETRLFTGIIRDISEHKETTDRIRLQGAALEAAANAIMLTDAQGTILWVNRAFTALTGYSAAEAIGNTPRILHSSQEDADRLHQMWLTIQAGGVWHGELLNQRKDGSTYIEEQTVTPLTDSDGRITHFVAIKQDISARKRDEQAIADQACAIEAAAAFERTHSRILALFSASYDRKTILQESLSILSESHRYPALAIYLYDEWHGTLNSAASFGIPGDFAQELAPNQGLAGQAAVEGRLLSIETPDGTPLRIETGLFAVAPAAVAACPIRFREQILGVLVLASLERLTERDRAFIERLCAQIGVALNNIRQYRDLKALSEQLKQRGQEIADKNRQLEQANRMKSEFLANMSHELRTPLNAIIGFSEVLKDGLLGPLNAKQQDYTGEVFDSANHLLSLINDILDLSKIEAGKMELLIEPLNLPELLRNGLSVVKEKAHTHGIQLVLEMAEDIGLVRADGRKLKQVVYNLLSNAVKFTPDGGRVTLDARRIDDRLQIEVSDTGIGIPADRIGQLFRPFEQLDGSLSRKYEGTGLGLAMVKRLVELHGGSVAVHSKEGEGSRFSISIPCRAAEAIDAVAAEWPAISMPTESATESTPAAPAAVHGRVLLVEDNDAAAELITRLLVMAGYTVQRAGSGAEGLKLAAASRPALIILDILLPDFDGWEVMRRMQQDPGLRTVPVVVVSIVADARKGLELGALEVLEKPVQKALLLDVVRRTLPVPDTLGVRPRVLVVDDDPAAVEFVSTHLAGAGYEVLRAYGGRQAIDLALSELPDLVVLDLMMPEVTGFDVVAALRGAERAIDIPVVILTAKVLTEEDRAVLSIKVDQVLAKSEFNTQAFLADVGRAMSRAGPADVIDRPREPGARSRILVVEDDPEQADLLRLYLEDAGYEVALAHNGREALQAMEERLPDLVTLDLLMPEMNGFAFLEAKAQRPEFAGVPVMVLSSVADQMEGSPLAADAVLRKPIRRAELMKVVDGILPRAGEKGEKKARPKLLVVDDDPKAIKIVSSYLPTERFEVLTAFGGVDGLELARAELPDLLVLDLMMPDMSGFEVLAALKRDEATRAIPVIVLTAKILTQQERDRLISQVAAIAEKGKANRDMLVIEINRILRRYRL